MHRQYYGAAGLQGGDKAGDGVLHLATNRLRYDEYYNMINNYVQ
jgi:hypothetical protein